MFMNFDLAPESRALVDTIVERFFAAHPDHPVARTNVTMDLIACHNGGCPLDFAAMATFEDFSSVAHDITGIGRYLDRETGELDDHFHPRFALPEPLKPGDKVSYTNVTQRGLSFNFSSREGTLVQIHGVNAQVKAKNGRLLWVNTADLRRVGQQNALTENFLKMVETIASED